MIFKEAFENYRSGTATPEETEYIQQELEKNQLLSEYMEKDFEIDLESENTSSAELKKVKKTIRRRSRNLVAISVAIVIFLAVMAHYAASPLLNKLYYNPMTNEVDEFAYDVNFPFIAYTELHQAGIYYGDTIVENTGIGKYSMTLVRYDLSTGESDYLSASMDKNKLDVPVSFKSDNLSMNIFARASSPTYDLDAETKENFIKELEALPDYINVTAAVSFSEDLNMSQLIDTMGKSDLGFLWAGIRNSPEDVQRYPLCGMDLTGAGYIYEGINKEYPKFELSSTSSNADLTAADYETHFKSLVKYSMDHADFLKSLEDSDYATYYSSVLDYVESDGVKTYGVMVQGSATDILALMDNGNVSQIWPMNADVSF